VQSDKIQRAYPKAVVVCGWVGEECAHAMRVPWYRLHDGEGAWYAGGGGEEGRGGARQGMGGRGGAPTIMSEAAFCASTSLACSDSPRLLATCRASSTILAASEEASGEGGGYSKWVGRGDGWGEATPYAHAPILPKPTRACVLHDAVCIQMCSREGLVSQCPHVLQGPGDISTLGLQRHQLLPSGGQSMLLPHRRLLPRVQLGA
jgi:hypothetical protein